MDSAHAQVRKELLARLHGRCPYCDKPLLLHDRVKLNQQLAKCHSDCIPKGQRVFK